MNASDVKKGLRVRTTNLGDTIGLTINTRHLDVRREGVEGVVEGHVPGHGGDVWFVKHDGTNQVGAYTFTEFEPA